jgi:hypothetical protein
MKKGNSYLVKRRNMNTVSEVKCLEISDKCYKIRWAESGKDVWFEKREFDDYYWIVEELNKIITEMSEFMKNIPAK